MNPETNTHISPFPPTFLHSLHTRASGDTPPHCPTANTSTASPRTHDNPRRHRSSNSVVRLNGSDRTTSVISASQLKAAIPASDVAAGGSLKISVFTPAPGGGTSVVQNLTVVAASNAPSPIPSPSPSPTPSSNPT